MKVAFWRIDIGQRAQCGLRLLDFLSARCILGTADVNCLSTLTIPVRYSLPAAEAARSEQTCAPTVQLPGNNT